MEEEEEEEDTNTDLNIIHISIISSQVVTMERVSVDSELAESVSRVERRLSPECHVNNHNLHFTTLSTLVGFTHLALVLFIPILLYTLWFLSKVELM